MGVTAVAVAAVVGGCGGTSTLHTAKIAQAIEATILTQYGVQTTVTCPTTVPEKAGYHFACVAGLTVGAYPMNVIEHGTDGRVSYTGAAPLQVLNSKAIETAIAAAMRKHHLKATVSCPQPVLQASGLSFACTATYKKGAAVFTVTETDGDGHVQFVED